MNNANSLIENNINFVYYIVNNEFSRYINDPIYEDLIQEGMLGLCKAANSYNSEYSKFTTYSYHYIAGYIRKNS